jgi:hypothetical protein
VCRDIQLQFLSYVDENLIKYRIDVKFSTESLILLAGDEPEIEIDSSDTEITISEDYLYFKRYWSRPGMGVSVGLLYSKKISAILGCYIHIDDDLYLLTVKHLVTKFYKRLIEGITDIKTLVSPAPVEKNEMKAILN